MYRLLGREPRAVPNEGKMHHHSAAVPSLCVLTALGATLSAAAHVPCFLDRTGQENTRETQLPLPSGEVPASCGCCLVDQRPG